MTTMREAQKLNLGNQLVAGLGSPLAIIHAVMAQRVAKAPEFLNDVRHACLFYALPIEHGVKSHGGSLECSICFC